MSLADEIDNQEVDLRLVVSACARCGRPCQPGVNKNPGARPFRRAKKGLCPNCAVTKFIKSNIPTFDISALKSPAIQKQFAEILRVGMSELQAKEIDWEIIINQWELSFPREYKPK